MSEIKIASMIAQKRREKGITQEELAEYMGVSKAAVSKWEKEQSYPDITLLPHLATYFNLSIDELLDYSPQLTRENTQKLYRKLAADFMEKSFDDVLTECRAVTKKYYSCFPLLYQMAALLVNHQCLAGSQERQDEVLGEAVALCQRVISESRDALLSKDALYLLCHACLALRRPQDVLAMMGESLRMSAFKEDCLISQAFQLAGNPAKAKEILQCGIYQYLMSLTEALLSYAALSEDAEAEPAYLRAMEIIRLFTVGKLDPNLTLHAYVIGANFYCKTGHPDKALELLEQFADVCLHAFFPYKLRGDGFFTAIGPWLDSGDICFSLPSDEKLIRQSMLQGVSMYPSFAALADEPRYKRVVEKLTEFVGAEL